MLLSHIPQRHGHKKAEAPGGPIKWDRKMDHPRSSRDSLTCQVGRKDLDVDPQDRFGPRRACQITCSWRLVLRDMHVIEMQSLASLWHSEGPHRYVHPRCELCYRLVCTKVAICTLMLYPGLFRLPRCQSDSADLSLQCSGNGPTEMCLNR